MNADEGPSDRASKAINIPMVLEKVAQNLGTKDLRTLRATCPLWNYKFIPELQKKEIIHIRSDNAPAFTDLMRPSPAIPFGKYLLSNIQPRRKTVSEAAAAQNYRDVIATCGAAVRILHTMPEGNLGVAGLRNALFGGQFPKLEELSIFVCSSHEQGGGGGPPQAGGIPATDHCRPAIAMPLPLPHLRSLNFVGCETQDPGYTLLLVDILRATDEAEGIKELCFKWHKGREYAIGFFPAVVAALLEFKNLHKLTELSLPLLKGPELQGLISLGVARKLRLQSLYVEADDENADVEEAANRFRLLNNLLEALAPTLNQLSITVGEGFGNVDLYLPRLPLLQTLNMDNPRKVVYGDGGSFTGCFPALRCLQFFAGEEERDTSNVTSIAHFGVKELEVRMTVQKFSALRPRLPLITKADLKLAGVGLGDCVCVLTTWPTLTHLSLDLLAPKDDLEPDVLLTGVRPGRMDSLKRSLQQLLKNCNHQTPTLAGLRGAVSALKTQRSIADMAQLQQFVLWTRTENSSAAPKLTDVGVYFGLALAGGGLGLQRACVHGMKGNWVSGQGAAFLRSTLGPNADINLSQISPPKPLDYLVN